MRDPLYGEILWSLCKLAGAQVVNTLFLPKVKIYKTGHCFELENILRQRIWPGGPRGPCRYTTVTIHFVIDHALAFLAKLYSSQTSSKGRPASGIISHWGTYQHKYQHPIANRRCCLSFKRYLFLVSMSTFSASVACLTERTYDSSIRTFCQSMQPNCRFNMCHMWGRPKDSRICQ